MTGRVGGGALACLQMVALLLLAPPMATAEITVGPTIDLPWSTWVDFQGGTVALLANGSFAITTDRGDIIARQVQFFNAAGHLIRSRLLKPPVVAPQFVGVGSLGSSYFVVWQDYLPDGVAYAHAFSQLYSDKGTPLGTPILWPSSAVSDFAEFYRFGSAPRWRFLPITYDLLPDLCDANPIYQASLRVAEPNAMPQLPPNQLGPPVVSNIEDAAVNGRGRFVVDSFQCASQCGPSPCPRGIQIFDDAMRPITSFLTAEVTQTNTRVFTAINAQGQVLLSTLNSAGRFVVRLYDQNGSPATDEIPVDTMDELPDPSPVRDMKGLDDGSFALAWIDQTASDGEALVVTRFDPKTRTSEAPVVIATTSYEFRKALLKLNGNGRGVVVWESQDAIFGPFAGHFSLINVQP